MSADKDGTPPDDDKNASGDSPDGNYRKPPREFAFQKGKSGNPNGRPKGSKNKRVSLFDEKFDEYVITEAFREVSVKVDGKSKAMPVVQAILRTMGVLAMKGNTRAAQVWMSRLAASEERAREEKAKYTEAVAEYIQRADAEVTRLRSLGRPTNHVQPHPDDVRFDMDTGMPYFVPPVVYTKKEIVDILEMLDKRIADLESQLAGEKEPTDTPQRLREFLGNTRYLRIDFQDKLKSLS